MDLEQYESTVLKILQIKEWYIRVSPSFVEATRVKYKNFIGRAFSRGIIDKSTLEFLDIANPRTPTLYALPKTHKNL